MKSSTRPLPEGVDADAQQARIPAIELEDLKICYGDFTAVDRLSLRVHSGEVFGLLGPNGAGKTTTFLSLIRQVPISAGSVRLLGLDVTDQFAQIKPQLGYVPDGENHFDDFTAAQNLGLFCDLYGVSRERIDQCLRTVELDRERNLQVKAFSKGMRKKLLLARALLHRPALLMLDEPTANLDVHSTELIRHLIQELAASGVTVLLTTHNMKEVEEVCHRVAIINHGRLIDLDTPIAFKGRHAERLVDVVFEDHSGGYQRQTVNLTDDRQRRDLAHLLESEAPVTIHTREFDFGEVFLRLTGERYN